MSELKIEPGDALVLMRGALSDMRETVAELTKALVWIHVHLGSECDWDELADDDDGMEARWYRDVSTLLDRVL